MVSVVGAFRRNAPSWRLTATQAFSMVRKPTLSSCASTRPASVSDRRGPRRSNSWQPRLCSRVRTCRLTALWVMHRLSPASVKEPSRAAASNARKA